MKTLLELRRRGEAVTGSVLNLGSGEDRFNYSKYFPNTSNYRCLDIKGTRNVHIVADVQKMPQIPDNGEDCLLALFLTHYISNIEAAMSEFRRILRPGGLILITFQGLKGTDRWGGHQWTTAEALDLAEKYFTINTFYTDEIGTLVVAYKDYQPMKEIWFDDGYTCVHDVAYPVMAKRGLTGIVAVATGAVGKTVRNYKRNVEYPCMTREDLITLIDEGWEIASHTVSHPLKFNELTLDEARLELENSKKWIIDNLGVTPTRFAFPRHSATAAQSRLARTLYQYVRPLAPGIMRYPPNIIVYHRVEAKWFEDRLIRDLAK